MSTLLPRMRALLLVTSVAMLAIATSAVAQAPMQQSSAERPAFDVASIRAHDPMDPDTNNYQPYAGGKFTATNCSPWMLIHYAFQLQPYQIIGGPNSIRTEHYDVVAKPAEIHPGTDDIPLMVQRLLEDRFQLKYHWEHETSRATTSSSSSPASYQSPSSLVTAFQTAQAPEYPKALPAATLRIIRATSIATT